VQEKYSSPSARKGLIAKTKRGEKGDGFHAGESLRREARYSAKKRGLRKEKMVHAGNCRAEKERLKEAQAAIREKPPEPASPYSGTENLSFTKNAWREVSESKLHEEKENVTKQRSSSTRTRKKKPPPPDHEKDITFKRKETLSKKK